MNGLQDKKILESNSALNTRQVEGRGKYNEDFDCFLHSSLDLDQLIVFEVDLLQDNLRGLEENKEARASLRRIQEYAVRNSENARDLRRKIAINSIPP